MFLEIFTLLIPLAAAIYRDPTKTLKSMPNFSNSLVNLGKMDLSFYFMAKPEDFSTDIKRFGKVDHSSGLFHPRTETVIEEPCPCSSKYSRNFPKNNPSELIKRMLASNDLFFNKEPESSVLCCESHENIHEETIYLELNPKKEQLKDNGVHHPHLPFLPFLFNNAGSSNPTLPLKPKAIEIFFLPKKNDIMPDFGKNNKNEMNKEAIQIVGDKELRNDFKTMKIASQHTGQSSVKKDLALQEKEDTLTTKGDKIKLDTTAASPNML